MLDLLLELPIDVQLSNGGILNISDKADWKTMLKCSHALSDESVDEDIRTMSVLTMFYNEVTVENIDQYAHFWHEMIKSMFYVLSYGNLKVEKNKPVLVNFEKDIKLILEGISSSHGEIRGKYLHWWTFLDYFHGIKDSTFNTVALIRYKKANNKKLQQWEKDYYRENSNIIKL